MGASFAPMPRLHTWLGFAGRGRGHFGLRRCHVRAGYLAGARDMSAPAIPRGADEEAGGADPDWSPTGTFSPGETPFPTEPCSDAATPSVGTLL